MVWRGRKGGDGEDFCTFEPSFFLFSSSRDMKGLKLAFSDSDYVAEEEIKVIAIQAPGIPSYTLVHFLNKRLSWDLRHTGQCYYPGSAPAFSGDLFNYVMEVDRVQCFLLPNRDERSCWVTEVPDVDYWMVLTGGGLDVFDWKGLVDEVSGIGMIFYVNLYPWRVEGRRPAKNGQVFGRFQEFYMDMDEQGLLQRFD